MRPFLLLHSVFAPFVVSVSVTLNKIFGFETALLSVLVLIVSHSLLRIVRIKAAFVENHFIISNNIAFMIEILGLLLVNGLRYFMNKKIDSKVQ